jgi:2Fe-2S ferredoxin
MAKITYRTALNGDMTFEVPDGYSVMEGAVREGVPGIEAECGGVCSCATCRVEVVPEWLARLEPKSDDEDAMLEFTIEPTERSRLSCQIKVSPDLEGLVVEVPVSQR